MGISAKLAEALHVIIDHVPFREQSVQQATHQAVVDATDSESAVEQNEDGGQDD